MDRRPVSITSKGVGRKSDDAPLRAGESSIADAHWQALIRASGKAEGALLAALTRKPTTPGGKP